MGSTSYSWLGITGFAVLSLTANIVFLIGCISPTTKDICLYRVEVALLADSLERQALADTGYGAELVLSPELPTYWYWGMSGICDVFETTGERRCRRSFLPTQNLLSVLEESLRDGLGDDQAQLTASILSSWNTTLRNISPSRLAAKEGKYAAQTKASAALAILASILDFFSPFIALGVRNSPRSDRRRAFIMPFISSLIAFAAGILATLAMRDGVHGVVDTSEHGGPAIIILFVGAALRFLSCGGACCVTSRDKKGAASDREEYPDSDYHRHDDRDEVAPPERIPLETSRWPEMTRNEEIGFLGERHIFKWLQECGLPGWSYTNWTSGLRKHAGHPDFREPERDYADFTYDDTSGRLLQALEDEGVPVSPDWSEDTRYHLEVKSTPVGCGARFNVSAYQVEFMKAYARDPLNAYILVRIFHVEGAPRMRFFVDPWNHPGLRWGPLGDDGYYPVWTI